MARLHQAYRRLRFGSPIVVVSGLPRSGTSMTMKMLEAGGMTLVTDGRREADEDNPKGYYEDDRVLGLAEQEDRGWLRSARGRAIKIISFLLKDLPPTNNYKVVLMRRDLDEVLASQQTMLERRGEASETGDERMRELWTDHLWRVGYLLKHRPQFQSLEVHYRSVLDDAAAEARRIAEFVGADLDPVQMATVVDRELYRNRAAPAAQRAEG